MANLTLKAKSFCSLSHSTNTQTSVFKTTTSFKNNSLHFLHSGNSLKFRVWCGVKEKENVKESERVPDVPAGLKKVDELNPKRGSSLNFEQRLGDDSGSSEVGVDWKWPPWKNIPLRYKLIGTTSLAFVICNMDKVNLSIAIIPMSHQFGWNASTAGLVQSSFFWGYALSQLPGGWLAKIFGGRLRQWETTYLSASNGFITWKHVEGGVILFMVLIVTLGLFEVGGKVLQIGVLTWSVATALLPFLAGYMPGFVLSRVLVCAASSHTPYVEQVFLSNLLHSFSLLYKSDYFCGLWSVLLTSNNLFMYNNNQLNVYTNSCCNIETYVSYLCILSFFLAFFCFILTYYLSQTCPAYFVSSFLLLIFIDQHCMQVDTFGRAITSCSICLWGTKCRKCYRASFSSSTYSKFWLGICILYIWLSWGGLVSICPSSHGFQCLPCFCLELKEITLL
ncbi:hypothetical protein NC653_040118 [Populus alba x Populus x berolinensis]|uniref:Uncharacterized protein n=1 Tax=Populus alba x Populus x berolinensis TaxID=444605 RepID=A0AAD6LEF6_9ROSI|nr:hypothetical protein NC653_040118 [Populus alba x Populus x berolinensis]